MIIKLLLFCKLVVIHIIFCLTKVQVYIKYIVYNEDFNICTQVFIQQKHEKQYEYKVQDKINDILISK